jgi:hypothetical protein
MPFKWVPNAAETPPDSHDGHFEFCPAKSQLYRVVVKPLRDHAADPAIAWTWQCSWQMAGDGLIDEPRS